MKHILIVGEPHVGKSTMIKKLLSALNLSACGYITKREKEISCGELKDSVHIYEIGKPFTKSEDNLIADFYYDGRKEIITINEGAFDRFAPRIERLTSDKEVIIFDEIGFLESHEKKFCEAILNKLDGNMPVFAAIQARTDIQFLEDVRRHHQCKCFYITRENRDALFVEILEYVRQENVI